MAGLTWMLTSKGWRAAPFIYAMIALENMAFVSVGINLFPYLFNVMHFSITESANGVTNFMGTALLLNLFGGFISDVFLSKVWTISIGGLTEALGLMFLTLSASISALRPPQCPPLSPTCEQADATDKYVLFLGLYLIAIGAGAVKSNLAALGADQFDEGNREISSYFNGGFTAFCLGSIFAVTVLVYVQDNISRKCGYVVALVSLLSSILVFMGGRRFYGKTYRGKNPLTRVAQVFVAAIRNRKLPVPVDEKLHEIHDKESASLTDYIAHTDQFRFLDKAAIPSPTVATESPWKLCTVTQVEEVKIVLRIIPVFASTIMMSCVLGQLQTFSVAQGNTMDRKLGSNFELPPASLAFFPSAAMVIMLPLYDRFFVPLARRITGHEHGITHLQRVGLGLLVAILSMAMAALVEKKRIRLAAEHNLLDNPAAVVPMKIYWLGLQYLTFGIADMFTFVGLQEFFYSESPSGLKSMATSLAYVSLAIGFFISSLLVSVVNVVTRRHGNPGWLPDNLNRSKLSAFYWLLAILSAVNLLSYVLCARWYKYREVVVPVESKTVENEPSTSIPSNFASGSNCYDSIAGRSKF